MLIRAAPLTLAISGLPYGTWAAPRQTVSDGSKVTLETRVTQRVTRVDDGGAEEIVYLEDTWLAPGAVPLRTHHP